MESQESCASGEGGVSMDSRRKIPDPLYPCCICYEDHSWPAKDLFWSEPMKDWVCDQCWDDVDAHWTDNGRIDYGITLAEEIRLTIRCRLLRGWSAESAIFDPVKGGCSH